MRWGKMVCWVSSHVEPPYRGIECIDGYKRLIFICERCSEHVGISEDVLEMETKLEKQATCEHNKFRLHPSNWIGDGTCEDCGLVLPVYDIINDRIERMEQLIEKMET